MSDVNGRELLDMGIQLLPMITCTKVFADLPFAHRQHNHVGHCRLIHGHNWTFEFEFTAKQLDACGFIIDFGGREMKVVKAWLERCFDHTLVLNESDPMRPFLESTFTNVAIEVANITVVPDGSCEGLARWCFQQVNAIIARETDDRVLLVGCTVRENAKNFSTFKP